jgi:cell division protein FtsQ
MSFILEPLGLKVLKISLDSGNFWEIWLDSGLKIQLGQDRVLTRLQRFVKVYPKLFKSDKKTAKSVDLRYPHGLAVKW